MNTLLAQVNLKDYLFGTDSDMQTIGTYTTDRTLGDYISSVLPTIYIASGLILFLYMVFGGVLIIASSGDSKKTDEGKQVLTNAIIGFGIIFTSYWIIQIIEVITGIPIV